MDHDVIDTDIIETPAGIFKIDFEYDPDAMSPRDADNVGEIVINHRRLITPDEDSDVARAVEAYDHGHGVSLRAACRYLRGLLGARVVLPVQVSAHDSSYRVLDPSDEGAAVHGFTYDTATGRALLVPIGASYDPTDEEITQALTGEVLAYDQWAQGEYVQYVIYRLTDEDADVAEVEDDPSAYSWDVVDSLGSVDDLAYARREATDTVRSYTPEDFPSRALAAQV